MNKNLKIALKIAQSRPFRYKNSPQRGPTDMLGKVPTAEDYSIIESCNHLRETVISYQADSQHPRRRILVFQLDFYFVLIEINFYDSPVFEVVHLSPMTRREIARRSAQTPAVMRQRTQSIGISFKELPLIILYLTNFVNSDRLLTFNAMSVNL